MSLSKEEKITRGTDVTEVELADLKLFMSYDEVIEVFKVKRPDAKVTTLKKIPCAQDKIDANNSNIKAKKNCIRAVVFERAYGAGEGYMVVASFVEDLPNNSGTSIVTEVLYKQYYGKKKAKLRDFTNSVKEKYGVYRSDMTNTHLEVTVEVLAIQLNYHSFSAARRLVIPIK